MTGKEIVNYIRSLKRVGCDPFKFLSEDFFLQYNEYELVECSLNDIDMSSIIGYRSDYKKRIQKKVKDESERDKYYKIYEKTPIPPVVISHEGEPMDGFHRLAHYRDNGITKIKAYRGVK